ncbi:MAG: general secretion pathway protein GspB [Piscinibacter sp.]|uniref:general secretion pathway protein GspB n=1 Tax=Piscinibacter sp. TaxID=1903157 RepID=UPI001B6BDB61|nr:general secretion pathway protein GspB [Piscinibacter sp.]MBP5989699.1 general secretion pathway protein GspB [Piscinibacter sp.]MBP6027875.1 general secretion pathway protein GspB [Piscinibacter sp.]
MSYILDALRRADAERERGGVPGLHTQTMAEPGDEADIAPRARGLKPWHWLAIGLAGGLAVAIAWSWRGEEPPPPVAVLPPAPPPPALPAPAAPAAIAPIAVTEAPPASPVAIAPMRAAPPPPAAAARPAAPAPASAAASTIPRIASLAELPPELRSGLPALAFGGSIYSGTPANRLLIVNGQLMHEGESLAPGVTLEQIKPKAAVLNIRGQRFEIGL